MKSTRLMILGLCAAGLGMAHSLYLLPAKFQVPTGEMLIFSVHNGDSFPASEEAADSHRFEQSRLVCAHQAATIEDYRTLGKAVHSGVKIDQPGSCWLAVATSARTLTMEGAKFEAYLADEGLTNIVEARHAAGLTGPGRERYRKFAKSYVVAGEGPAAEFDYTKPLGLAIEFVPQSDPGALHAGDMLRVQLLRDGKPLANTQVESAWAGLAKADQRTVVVGRTDAEGRITVPVERAGKWRLHAVTMEPAVGLADADWSSYWASMTFAVR
jgi:hypothetical protein